LFSVSKLTEFDAAQKAIRAIERLCSNLGTLKTEFSKWENVIKAAGIKIE